MSQRGLEALLRPKSIAVLGASQQPGRAGNLMMSNLLAGGFGGPILPVTPRYKAVCGVMAYPDVASLPLTPDLAIICTHAKRNLALIEALGQRGCKTAIVLSSPPEQFAELKACAQRYAMRLLGPNGTGLLAPWQASTPASRRCRSKRASWRLFRSPPPWPTPFSTGHSSAKSVSLTLSRWATARTSTSTTCSTFGARQQDQRHFAVSGKHQRRAALSLRLAQRLAQQAHSGDQKRPQPTAQLLLNSQLGLDAAYDAAIQRAGLLRVQDTHELFSAVETLSHMHPLRGGG